MKHHSTYFGIFIYRKTTFGPQLRWTTVEGGLAADTLAGIRQLIRSSKKSCAPIRG
jgi:hypothetical protein